MTGLDMAQSSTTWSLNTLLLGRDRTDLTQTQTHRAAFGLSFGPIESVLGDPRPPYASERGPLILISNMVDCTN